MILQCFLLILAIVLLYYGAEFALESAEKIGLALGLSPLVIGLLIVGFGTSLPEFFVSQLATLRGDSSIALGNIVGSNIANLFLILGISGTMTSLFILRSEIKIQFIFHIVLTGILVFFLKQDKIEPWAATVFGVFFLVYLGDTLRVMIKKRGHIGHLDQPHEADKVHAKDYLILILGFVLLYFGGELLVSSGSKVAVALGVSSYVVSAVFVAFGTSFPELVTAVMACRKGKNTDIITGNIIGSNVFNVAFVFGSLSFYDIQITSEFKTEIPVLIFAAFYLLFLALIKKNFTRFSGILFLSIYGFVIYNWIS